MTDSVWVLTRKWVLKFRILRARILKQQHRNRNFTSIAIFRYSPKGLEGPLAPVTADKCAQFVCQLIRIPHSHSHSHSHSYSHSNRAHNLQFNSTNGRQFVLQSSTPNCELLIPYSVFRIPYSIYCISYSVFHITSCEFSALVLTDCLPHSMAINVI